LFCFSQHNTLEVEQATVAPFSISLVILFEKIFPADHSSGAKATIRKQSVETTQNNLQPSRTPYCHPVRKL